MKISINTVRWINHSYQCTGDIMPDGIDALVEKIGAQLGAVEEVIDLSKKYHGIIIAKVISCEKHPNADKLSLCRIDDGGIDKTVDRDKDGYVQVICGAPNVREGILVAWLSPGSTVPSSFDKDPYVLEVRELRGKISNGMIASAHELAISDDHDGILEITDDFEPGEDFAKVYGLNGHVIDIENKMFTHRPDCFGFLGVARELAGIQHMAFKSPKWYQVSPNFPKLEAKSPTPLKLDNKLTDLVPRFCAITMSEVRVGPSPTWLQIELAKVGQRPINNIVDYTNFFMLETGQPLHAYDADKLKLISKSESLSLETRKSKKGEKLKLLNGKEITFHDDSAVLITSGDVPVGIGGVMGGSDTEVDENTTNIVVECANFDMYSIRRTSMKYGLFTDAVTRFNKGQSPLQNLAVLARIVNEIRKKAGGKVASVVYDDNNATKAPKLVRASNQFINERLGLELSADEMQILLENVEFSVERTDNKDELKITAPFWRTDIEIPEDLVEEIGRLYGYDHLPLVLPKRDLAPVLQSEMLTLKSQISEVLARGGANEVLTYSFVHGNLLEKVGQDRNDAFELSNAISPDLQYYRISLTPSLLDKVHMNIKAGFNQFAMFEINKTHIKGQTEESKTGLPKEVDNLALVVAGSSKAKAHGAAYYHAKQYLAYIGKQFGINFRYEPLTQGPTYPAAAPFDYKRSAKVYVGNKSVGLIGEFRPSVKKALKLPEYSAGFEIGISPTIFNRSASQYQAISKFPSVQQDITLKIPSKHTFAEVYEFVQDNLSAPKQTQMNWQPLDIYQGEDKKHKNITLRLIITSYVKTLTDSEVNALLDGVADKAKIKLGASRI